MRNMIAGCGIGLPVVVPAVGLFRGSGMVFAEDKTTVLEVQRGDSLVDESKGLPPVSEVEIDKAIRLRDGDWIVYRYSPFSDSGVQVFRMDPSMKQRRWQVSCKGLGVEHSKYAHKADVERKGDSLVVTSVGSSGQFTERVDLETGAQLERK